MTIDEINFKWNCKINIFNIIIINLKDSFFTMNIICMRSYKTANIIEILLCKL